MKNFLLDIIRGIVIGVANIIPGVSGGTMMVTMGVYDKVIGAITGIVKQFKKSVKVLLPYFIGMAVGICAFAYLLTKVLLVKWPMPTAFAFIGLIVGGIPVLISKTRKAKYKKSAAGLLLQVLVFAVFFAIIIGMQFLSAGAERVAEPSILTALILLVMGILAAAAMVIPGVSGSLILLAFGYYNSVTGALTAFLSGLKSFDIEVLWHNFLLLFPFGLGVLIGIFYVAKLMEWLMKHHERLTYLGILGLVAASPVPVYMSATGGTIGVGVIIASAIALAAGTAVAYFMGRE